MDNSEFATLGGGCFWCVEAVYLRVSGVLSVKPGYAGGHTKDPTYEEVCSGKTGHAESVLVIFNPDVVSYGELVKVFFENHDPTQGMRQGGDIGTQYRSVIFALNDEQAEIAKAAKAEYQTQLETAGYGAITTEITPFNLDDFYFAEEYHQQYLAKNPSGYCGLGGTGVSCPIGVMPAES